MVKYLIYELDEFWFSIDSIASILTLRNVADKYRITIDTSAEHSINVYFLKRIEKFKELGNRAQGLIPDDNSIFKEHSNAKKKVIFKDKVKVIPRKIMLPR